MRTDQTSVEHGEVVFDCLVGESVFFHSSFVLLDMIRLDILDPYAPEERNQRTLKCVFFYAGFGKLIVRYHISLEPLPRELFKRLVLLFTIRYGVNLLATR